MIKNQLSHLTRISIFWNTIESIAYQGIMCIHHAFLFATIDRVTYGSAGVLFSSIYALITMANIGLDGALGTWWHAAITNQTTFIRYVWRQYIPQLVLLVPGTALLIYVQNYEWHIYPIILLLAILESAKRTLKASLYLNFANKLIAPTEVFLISIYVSIIWSSLWIFGTLSALALVTPLIISSALGVCIYTHSLYFWYKTLPKIRTVQPEYTTRQIMTLRGTNYITQLTHLLFSGNILIPLFADRFGLEVAGTLKFVHTLAYGTGTLMHKIVATTSQALFAYTKQGTQSEHKEVFASCTNKIYQLAYLVAIVALINGSKFGTSFITIGLCSAAVFAAVIMSENICTIYEQFLTIRGHGHYNVVLQIASFIMTYVIIYHVPASLSSTLILLLSVRITTVIIFECLVRALSDVKSDLRLEPIYGIGVLLLSLIMFWAW